MRRLIWGFAGRTYHIVGNLMSRLKFIIFVCLYDLILYVPSTIFQLNRDGPSLVEPVLS